MAHPLHTITIEVHQGGQVFIKGVHAKDDGPYTISNKAIVHHLVDEALEKFRKEFEDSQMHHHD